MKAAAIALALFAPMFAACVTSSNLCVAGYVYNATYDACLAEDAGTDASPAVDAGSTVPEAAPSEGGSGEASTEATGLGDSCNASSDCTGGATYCLKSPTAAPTAAGICSFTNCTAAECTSAYSCCDCSASVLSSLQAFPPGVCIPSGSATQVIALGCKCQ
jgi:hypothetical protein